MSSIGIIIDSLVQAFLSEILFNDVSASNLIIAWLNGTVLAASIAVIIEVLLFAVSAFPEDEVRSHQNRLSHFLVSDSELLNEVQCSVIRRGVPDIILHSIIRLLQIETSYDYYLRQILWRRILNETKQFLAVLLGDKHGRNPDAPTCPIVTQYYLFNALICAVYDYS
jgi:hypothetical protein